MKTISANRRITLSNAIEKAFESRTYNEWEIGFLEDIQKRIRNGKDLSHKQHGKLLDLIMEYI